MTTSPLTSILALAGSTTFPLPVHWSSACAYVSSSLLTVSLLAILTLSALRLILSSSSPRRSLTRSFTSAEASSTRPRIALAMFTPTVRSIDRLPGLKSAAKVPLSGNALSLAPPGVPSRNFWPSCRRSRPR